MWLYDRINFQGKAFRAWVEPGKCYFIPPENTIRFPIYSIKMDRLPQWIIDQKKNIKCHFDRASWCEYPMFELDSWHDHLDLVAFHGGDYGGLANGYWCDWFDGV